jgi:hypothetical protein
MVDYIDKIDLVIDLDRWIRQIRLDTYVRDTQINRCIE